MAVMVSYLTRVGNAAALPGLIGARRTEAAVAATILLGVVLRLGHLPFIDIDLPFVYGALFLDFAEAISANGYRLIITGAALIMVAVFGGFALGPLSMFQQMGFGLAVAVILDATIVRMVLVPASMELLGDKNWYFPSWLEWLPRISIEGEVAAPAGTASAAVPTEPAG